MECARWEWTNVAGTHGPVACDHVVTYEQRHLSAGRASDLGPVRVRDALLRAVIGPVVVNASIGPGLGGNVVVVRDALDRASHRCRLLQRAPTPTADPRVCEAPIILFFFGRDPGLVDVIGELKSQV